MNIVFIPKYLFIFIELSKSSSTNLKLSTFSEYRLDIHWIHMCCIYFLKTYQHTWKITAS